MASGAANKVLAARASAVLTTGEVAATRLDLNETFNSRVTVSIDFTVGSLTNCTFRYFVSMDGTTYYPIETTGGGVVSHVLTADGTKVVTIDAPGWKWFRVSAQGSGTVTNSLAALSYRYLQRGSQR
jgi:hypothetical protein